MLKFFYLTLGCCAEILHRPLRKQSFFNMFIKTNTQNRKTSPYCQDLQPWILVGKKLSYSSQAIYSSNRPLDVSKNCCKNPPYKFYLKILIKKAKAKVYQQTKTTKISPENPFLHVYNINRRNIFQFIYSGVNLILIKLKIHIPLI